MTDSAAGKPGLVRQLGVVGLWLIIVNGMIGAGIFGLGAGAAKLAGPYSPWVFVLCALVVLPIMWSFAALASRFDGTGGPVLYVEAGLGRFASFQTGWAFWVARLTAFSANLVLLVSAIGLFFPTWASGAGRLTLLTLICGVLALNNVWGATRAVGTMAVLTVLKFSPLLLVVGLGLASDPIAVPIAESDFAPDWPAAVLLVLYAYVGFESGLVPAGEARQPQRDLPRALMSALLIVALLYAGLQWVSLKHLPGLAESERPMVDLANALLGVPGASVMMLGLVASVGGNLAGSMLSTPRVTYALAREGSLPTWFASVHPRFATPANSILFYAAAALLLATWGSFVWLAGLSVLTRLLIYLASLASMPRIYGNRIGAAEALRLPLGPLVPALAAAVCLFLLTQVGASTWLGTLLFLLFGSLLYGLNYWLSRPARYR
ncbi:APC family permease [Pseudomarimonas arenosa]